MSAASVPGAASARIDDHGNGVRPPVIQDARARFRGKEIDAQQLRLVEDAAILGLLSTQNRPAMSCVTDGGFRNGDYRSPVLHAVEGFERTPGEMLPSGLGLWKATGPLTQRTAIALDDARFLLENTALPVKVVLPSPSHMAAQTYSEDASRAYPGAAALGDALAAMLRAELEVLFEMGVRLVQFDNPDYSAYLVGREGDTLSFEDAVRIDNAVVAGIAKEEDQKVALTLGWGAHLDGTIDARRAERLFASDFDTFAFPFHNEDAVAQNLPAIVPAHKQVGLGIVDAGDPALEDLETLRARLDIATDRHEVDRVTLSPSGPFQPANYLPVRLSVDDQGKKLELVATLATTIWRNLV